MINVETFERPEGSEAYFVLCTLKGKIKRVKLADFATVRSNGLIAMSLMDDDILGWAKYTDGNQHIITSTENGQSIRFKESKVRVMSRGAGGVNAIRLEGEDRVAGMDVVRPEHTQVLVLTRFGYGKRTPLEEYRTQGRYGNGIRTIARNEKTGPVVAVRCISEDDGIVVLTKQGLVLRTSLAEIREAGRNTQGVRVIRIAKDDEVVGMALLSNDDETTSALRGETGENGTVADSTVITDTDTHEIVVEIAEIDDIGDEE